MVNVGSKITNKVDKISTNNQGGVEYKANGCLIHSINLQFDEMAEQIQDKMPCIPVIVRVLIIKNK